MTLRRLLLVVVGGSIGTAARLALAALIPDLGGFPLATLTVNLVGALLIGILTARVAAAELRLFLGTGILGGFTTYSAFAVGSLALGAESPLLAALYAAITLLCGFAAVALGLHIGRRRASRDGRAA